MALKFPTNEPTVLDLKYEEKKKRRKYYLCVVACCRLLTGLDPCCWVCARSVCVCDAVGFVCGRVIMRVEKKCCSVRLWIVIFVCFGLESLAD